MKPADEGSFPDEVKAGINNQEDSDEDEDEEGTTRPDTTIAASQLRHFVIQVGLHAAFYAFLPSHIS